MPPTVQVTASENIPQEALDRLEKDLAGVLPVSDVHRLLMRSAEPPTILQVIASAPSWDLLLKTAALAFAAAIGKNAGDAAWKNKGAVAAALKDKATAPLLQASTALLRIGSAVPHPLQLMIGIDYPDPHFGAGFRPRSDSVEEVASSLASLALQGERVQEILRKHEATGTGPLGPVHLTLHDSGKIQVAWMDDSGRTHSEHFPAVAAGSDKSDAG